ncbi:MAG: hypothetical protein OFPI_12950 [Osedax symbiont Rs2]|nr:MAG: hypothetical protein OFPI_12950 [Osedax symbiont Rs2]
MTAVVITGRDWNILPAASQSIVRSSVLQIFSKPLYFKL